MYRVLIIEDDEILNDGLCYNLEKLDIRPYPAYSLAKAREAILKDRYDLIILDVNLPDGDGFRFAQDSLLCRKIPFIFLTAHSLEDEVVGGFKLGADDYITKPFRVKVVMERIQAVLRRCGGGVKEDIYTCGPLTVDFQNRTVSRGQEFISLTPTEFDILQFFCRNTERILTKEVLLEQIWDSRGNYVNDHTLSLNISRLRSKLEDGKMNYIKTIYGMGYKWVGDEDE